MGRGQLTHLRPYSIFGYAINNAALIQVSEPIRPNALATKTDVIITVSYLGQKMHP